MVTHRKLAESALIRDAFSALHDAAGHVGSLQIRSVATVGGNISNGLPSADTACPLLILDAAARIVGPQGGKDACPSAVFLRDLARRRFAPMKSFSSSLSPPLPPGRDPRRGRWGAGRPWRSACWVWPHA